MKHYRSKPTFRSNETAGHLYYVRLKTKFGPLYKLGFTSMSSVRERFAFQGNGDEKLLDEVFLFVFHKEAFEFEQRLHRYFEGKKAFGNYSNDPVLPLYKNGQSELYVDDVLGLDDHYTEVQALRTRERLPRKLSAKGNARLHWSLIAPLTLLRWLFVFIGMLLRCLEGLLDMIFRVEPKARGRIFGRRAAPPPARMDEKYEREIGSLLAWVRANKMRIHVAGQAERPGTCNIVLPDTQHAKSADVAALRNTSPLRKHAAENSFTKVTNLVVAPDAIAPSCGPATAVHQHAGILDVETCWIALPNELARSSDDDKCFRLTDEIGSVPLEHWRSVCDSMPNAIDCNASPELTVAYEADGEELWFTGLVVEAVSDSPPGEALLWDGIFWGRDDWVEEALAAGVSADADYDGELPAVFAAAYLNRTRTVELLAYYGAGYPSVQLHYTGAVLNDGCRIYDFPEPVECAIYHNNLPLLRTLLAMPARSEFHAVGELLTDRGWASATELAYEGKYSFLLEIVKSNLREACADGRSGSAEWIDAHPLEFAKGLVLLLLKTRDSGIIKPNIFPLRIATVSPDSTICGVGLRSSLRFLLDRRVGEFASVSLETVSFALVDSLPYLSFIRMRLNDTSLVEVIQVNHSDFPREFHYSDIALFVARCRSDMDTFATTRVDVHRMAEFVAAVLENDTVTAADQYKKGINLDLPLRKATEHRYYPNFYGTCSVDAATVIREITEPEDSIWPFPNIS